METRKLQRIVNLLMMAIERKALVSQYDHVVFYDNAISTFNGKIFISHPIELDLNCSVVAEDLFNVLKTIEDENVELTLTNSVLHVTSKDVKAELSTEVHEDNVVKTIKAMNIGSFDWENALNIPEDFIEGINNCKFSVGKDASCEYNSYCIHIIDNAIESSDGFRCTEHLMKSDMEEMLIPLSSAIALSAFVPELYIKRNGWCHFIDKDDVIFSVATVEGPFPDINTIMENSKPEVKIELPVQISNILSEYGKLSSGDTDIFKAMEVSIKGEEIVCKTKKVGCNVTKKIPFPGQKEEVAFIISPTLLHSVLNKTNTIGINFTRNIASFSSENFNHIITMPQSEEKETTGGDVPF